MISEKNYLEVLRRSLIDAFVEFEIGVTQNAEGKLFYKILKINRIKFKATKKVIKMENKSI